MLISTHEYINQLARVYNVPVYTGKMLAELADTAARIRANGFGYTGISTPIGPMPLILYASTPIGPIPLCYIMDVRMAHELCKALADYTFGEFRHSKSNKERIERAKQRMEER